jgi:hypothetical protein
MKKQREPCDNALIYAINFVPAGQTNGGSNQQRKTLKANNIYKEDEPL